MPIVSAPMLEQAGFVLNGGSEPVPTVNFAAKLNGVDQYWALSEEISLPVGYTCEIDVMYQPGSTATNDYFITASDSVRSVVYLAGTGVVESGFANEVSEASVDGVTAANLTYDGQFHTISVTSLSASASIGVLGARFNFTRTNKGSLKSLRVKNDVGNVVFEIPMTNKTQGATQLPTVGNVSATMANYNEDVWEEV